MDLRTCATTHFITTIRDGLVIKVQNIDSKRMPVIRTKDLRDVYEDGARILRRPTSRLVFDSVQVKRENLCFPVADRTLHEIKPKIDEFVPRADDDGDSGSDDNITLRQLRHRFLTKKRKRVLSDEYSKQDNANGKPVDDEDDLNEPLINLRPKRSKTAKAKRKCVKAIGVSSSSIGFTVKPEENLGSEVPPQTGIEQSPVICVKFEVSDTEQVECPTETFSTDTSSIGNNDGLNPEGLVSNGFQKMAEHEHESRVPLPCSDKYQICTTNEISYDHLEDIKPISVLVPWDGVNVKLETLEWDCGEFLELPPLPIKKQTGTTDAHSCIRSLPDDPNSETCTNIEDISEKSSSCIQDPDLAIDGINCCPGLHQEFNSGLLENKTEAESLRKLDEYLSRPGKNCHSNPDSVTSLTTEENLFCMEDIITDGDQPSTCSSDVMEMNVLNCEDELLETEKTQISASPIIDAESQSPSRNRTCDSADTISTSEPHQPPERLHSTRKAISPSSHERLCLVMNSVDIVNDADQSIVSECKVKHFDKETEKRASSLRSDKQYDKISATTRRSEPICQRKFKRSPRCITRKSQIAKGNFESPRFSRTLPNLSTGCTSIQGCSESAIAFSQRQMHDMESLSVKLMSELKSMKDIVEQKLLFEAYRNVPLKNDADEVKSAISNATKAEEMARKWLSVMARDCNRFCKIMEMTSNSGGASSDSLPPRQRKIVFADEAGGKLCHVKFFDDVVISPVVSESDDLEQRANLT